MEDREKEKELLQEVEGAGKEARILAMQERDKLLGWVAAELAGDELRILNMMVPGYDRTQKPDVEQIFVLDSLMRAAASYGETFGASKIVTSFPDFHQFFKLRGFEVDSTHAFTGMETIVRYE